MPIYLKCETKGFSGQGIGSIIQHHILLYGMSKILGVNFGFDGVDGLVDFCEKGDNNIARINNEYNTFFNFPKGPATGTTYKFELNDETLNFINKNKDSKEDILIYFNTNNNEVIGHCNQYIKDFYNNKTLMSIRDNLVIDDSLKYFTNGVVNVAVHVRRKNKMDVVVVRQWTGNPDGIWWQDEHRDMFRSEKDLKHFAIKESNFNRYVNLFKNLTEKFKNQKVIFHLYSQGEVDDFNDFLSLVDGDNHTIALHLNEKTISDIYHMSHADFLVMSVSSYSYICHLMGCISVWVPNKWNYLMYPNSTKLDDNYNLI